MFTSSELVPVTKFSRNIWKYLKEIDTSEKKIWLVKNNQLKAVVLPIEEYEYLLEQAENFEIYQQLKQRDNIPQNEYLSEEEFLKHLQNS